MEPINYPPKMYDLSALEVFHCLVKRDDMYDKMVVGREDDDREFEIPLVLESLKKKKMTTREDFQSDFQPHHHIVVVEVVILLYH
jgi:hypothetical protein